MRFGVFIVYIKINKKVKPEKNSRGRDLLPRWDDFRILGWVRFMENPEVMTKQTHYLLSFL